MKNLRLITNKSEINPEKDWVEAKNFTSKAVQYQGRTVQIVAKYQKSFSVFQRAGRIFLGLVATIFTLGIALRSKEVKQLFTKNSMSIGFAVPISESPGSIQDRVQRLGFINFYDHKDPATEVFGNFYLHNITYNGLTFKCSEAAYQAQKFRNNPGLMAKFQTVDGDGAFQLAKQHKQEIVSNWHAINLNIMREILVAKFSDPSLRQKLLNTGSSYLVEHTPVKGRDAFWADDHDGTGQNNLGRLLMEIRKSAGGEGVVPTPQQYIDFLHLPD